MAQRVLIVEDHEDLAEATAEFLIAKGLDVRVVSTGGAALTSAVEFRPDIVLCDLNLADMVGFDLARALRESPARNALFVIHTTLREKDHRGVVPEVDLYLSKPITEEKLQTLLELERRRCLETPSGPERATDKSQPRKT